MEERFGNDQVRHAGSVYARHVRYLVPRLLDVYRGDAQRYQPPVRNLWQCGRRHLDAHAFTGRNVAYVVPPEPTAAAREMVTTQQQQLSADSAFDLARLLQQEQQAVSEKLLFESQTLDRKAEERRACRLRFSRRRSAAR